MWFPELPRARKRIQRVTRFLASQTSRIAQFFRAPINARRMKKTGECSEQQSSIVLEFLDNSVENFSTSSVRKRIT